MCIPLFSPQHLTCLCYGREECAAPAASSLSPPLGALAIRFQKTKKMDFYFRWTSKSQAEINSCCCLLAWKTSTNHETENVSIYNDLIWLKPHQSELALKWSGRCRQYSHIVCKHFSTDRSPAGTRHKVHGQKPPQPLHATCREELELPICTRGLGQLPDSCHRCLLSACSPAPQPTAARHAAQSQPRGQPSQHQRCHLVPWDWMLPAPFRCVLQLGPCTSIRTRRVGEAREATQTLHQ